MCFWKMSTPYAESDFNGIANDFFSPILRKIERHTTCSSLLSFRA